MSMEMHDAWTWSMGMKYGDVEKTRSMDKERGHTVLFSISLDLLQLIPRGHCRFSTVKKCCFALCKESTPVLQFFQII